jgi:hypothetical protein
MTGLWPIGYSPKQTSTQRFYQAPKLDSCLGSGTVAVTAIPLASRVRRRVRRGSDNGPAVQSLTYIGTRVTELQEEQLAIHQQATAAAAANKQVTIESLIAEAEAARAKAMSEKGGSAAAVSALTAKAKLAGMWREKLDQHNTGSPVYERIERVIVERAPQSAPGNIPDESIYDEPSTEVVREMPGRHWSAD